MYGKILIQAELLVCTGMHIGGSDAFSAIGALDKPVIRDPFSNEPILPGSSLKGKLRTLLARCMQQDIRKMPNFNRDNEMVSRLFGSTQSGAHTRLQFSDGFVLNADELRGVGLTEVKAENSINRVTCVSNPRQIERVNRGVRFGVHIAYDIVDDRQIAEDFTALARAMKLLQYDYLGGHGSRGYGRVRFENISLAAVECDPDQVNLDALTGILKKGCGAA